MLEQYLGISVFKVLAFEVLVLETLAFEVAFEVYVFDTAICLYTNKTNDLILNLTPENVTQHSR